MATFKGTGKKDPGIVLQITVNCDPWILEKFFTNYPDKEAIAVEILRQIRESGALLTGNPINLKYRKWEGTR